MMKVLIACEESQEVCKAFRAKGHEAYSCDILPCSGGYSEWHLEGDVIPLLREKWDIIIAFPPCTYLCKGGAVWWKKRQKEQKEAFNFVKQIWDSPVKKLAIENPIGFLNTNWKKPTQIIHPYYFGDEWLKQTCLWLRGLQPLQYALCDNLFQNKTAVEPVGHWVSAGNKKGREHRRFTGYAEGAKRNQKLRSKTFPGIAKAMADQWG